MPKPTGRLPWDFCNRAKDVGIPGLIEEHGLAGLAGFVDGLQDLGDDNGLLGEDSGDSVVADGVNPLLGLFALGVEEPPS